MAAGFTQESFAEAAGLSLSGVRKLERGDVEKPRNPQRLADVLNVSVDWLMGHNENKLTTRPPLNQVVPADVKGLEVVGIVEAGVWREAVELPDGEREMLPVRRHPDFDGFDQYLLEIAGASMNVFYQPGACVHCIGLHYQPRDIALQEGDHVVVERQAHGLFESTVKELRGGKLWPRSTDPRYQEPVTLGETDGEVVTIRALVIGSYRMAPNMAGR